MYLFLFCGLGCFLVILGIILFFALPKSFNYERYKKQNEKHGLMNYIQMIVKVRYLEEKIKELEERVKQLE